MGVIRAGNGFYVTFAPPPIEDAQPQPRQPDEPRLVDHARGVGEPQAAGAVAVLLDASGRVLDSNIFHRAGADLLHPSNIGILDAPATLGRLLSRVERSGESCLKALRRGLINELLKRSTDNGGRFDPEAALALGVGCDAFERVLGVELARRLFDFVVEVYSLDDRALYFAPRGSTRVSPATWGQVDSLVWRALDDPGVFTRMRDIYRDARSEKALQALTNIDRCYVLRGE